MRRSTGSAVPAFPWSSPEPICSTANGCAGRAGGWTRGPPAGNSETPSRASARASGAAHAAAAARAIPTFHEYASYWLQARTHGVLGDKPIEANTRADYLWRLQGHLLPFFGARRLD